MKFMMFSLWADLGQRHAKRRKNRDSQLSRSGGVMVLRMMDVAGTI
jgi:hypothetical protein